MWSDLHSAAWWRDCIGMYLQPCLVCLRSAILRGCCRRKVKATNTPPDQYVSIYGSHIYSAGITGRKVNKKLRARSDTTLSSFVISALYPQLGLLQYEKCPSLRCFPQTSFDCQSFASLDALTILRLILKRANDT